MNLYTYTATVLRIIDGDTVELLIDLGFTIHWKSACRFYGINTPELNSTNEMDKIKAQAAKLMVMDKLPIGSKILIQSKDLDKYGRPLVEIYYGKGYGINLNDQLVKEKLAVTYKP
jgi:micrococcal nuclease